jgi:hypothetical protein
LQIALKAVDPLSPGVTSKCCNPDGPSGAGSLSTDGVHSGRPLSEQPLKLLWIALKNPLLYYSSICGILTAMAGYTMIFWLPIVINGLLRGEALTNLQVAAKGGGKAQVG